LPPPSETRTRLFADDKKRREFLRRLLRDPAIDIFETDFTKRRKQDMGSITARMLGAVKGAMYVVSSSISPDDKSPSEASNE
jgi:hypothetical protein